MAKTSQAKLKAVLTQRLKLAEPEFALEKLSGGKVSGNIVSDSFDGMDDVDRQRAIWEALEDEFGDEAAHLVGTLLAYTKAEWNIPLAGSKQTRRRSKAR